MKSTTQDSLIIKDVRGLIEKIQPDSIISRTVYSDNKLKVTIFGFDTGQSLSEHTASQPATIQVLQGEATITVAETTLEADVGTWIQMPAHTRHSIVAKTPLILLLTLVTVQVS